MTPRTASVARVGPRRRRRVLVEAAAPPRSRRTRRAGLLLPLLLLAAAGCAEMRQAPPPPPPADLVGTAPEPVRAALAAAAPAFADQGLGLAGRPAEAAQAAAQLEFFAARLPRDPRWAALPEGIGRELLLARSELRDALGVAETAAPERVVAALLSAARALRAGDRGAAAAALPAPTFRPGGARSVARLGELGPLPQTANATALAADAMARLEAEGRTGTAAQPAETTAGIGRFTTTGITAGY